MVGFCFGIGLMLAVKTVNNLEYCTEELITENKMAEENQQQVQQEP